MDGVVARGLVVDLVEAALVAVRVALLDGVLARVQDARAPRRLLRLVHEVFGVLLAPVVVALHLEAGEVHRDVVLAEDGLGDVPVPVVPVGVVIPGGELGGVRAVLVPPVDAGDLARELDLVLEHLARRRQDVLAVLHEDAGVPREEELAVRGAVVVKPVAEKAGVAGGRVVVPGVARSALAPLGVSRGGGCGGEALEHVPVVHLELADAAVFPAVELVAREPQLARGTEADLDLVDGAAHVLLERVVEALHEVAVDLDGRPAPEERLVVDAERQVLVVEPVVHVVVEDVRVLVAHVADELRDGDVAVVVDVAAAAVERHHRLPVQRGVLAQRGELQVRRPVVDARRRLDKAPPHVAHHAVHAAGAELLEVFRELLGVDELPVLDEVQRQHQVHRDGRRQPNEQKEGECAIHHARNLKQSNKKILNPEKANKPKLDRQFFFFSKRTLHFCMGKCARTWGCGTLGLFACAFVK